MIKPHQNTRHVYVTWPADLHIAVRSVCIQRGITLSEWIAEAARAHLAEGAGAGAARDEASE